MYQPEEVTEIYFNFLRRYFLTQEIRYTLNLRKNPETTASFIFFSQRGVNHYFSFTGPDRAWNQTGGLHFVMRTRASREFSHELEQKCREAIGRLEGWKKRIYDAYFGDPDFSDKPVLLSEGKRGYEAIIVTSFVMPGTKSPERNLDLERTVFGLTFPCFINPANSIVYSMIKKQTVT